MAAAAAAAAAAIRIGEVVAVEWQWLVWESGSDLSGSSGASDLMDRLSTRRRDATLHPAIPSHTTHCQPPTQITASLPHNSLPASHTNHCQPPVQPTASPPYKRTIFASTEPRRGRGEAPPVSADIPRAMELRLVPFPEAFFIVAIELDGTPGPLLAVGCVEGWQ